MATSKPDSRTGGGLTSGGKWEVVDHYNMALNLASFVVSYKSHCLKRVLKIKTSGMFGPFILHMLLKQAYRKSINLFVLMIKNFYC
jgi:hypothetical protein